MMIVFECQARYGGFPDGAPYHELVDESDTERLAAFRSGWAVNGSGEPVAIGFYVRELTDHEATPIIAVQRAQFLQMIP